MDLKSVRILNLEWNSGRSRDNTIIFLICNYLRMFGIKIEHHSIYDGLWCINKHLPDLFLIANSVGATENTRAMEYAKSRGILGVTLISEGNFQGDENKLSEMIWGWNKKKRLQEDIQMHWSSRTQLITLKMHPELEGRVKVSGGVGFDHCVISRESTEESALRKLVNASGFKRVVGIGCWDFGCAYPEDPRYGLFKSLYSEQTLERYRKDGLKFNEILEQTIRIHKDILFVIKVHPGEMLGDKASGIEGVRELSNVIVTKDEHSIRDCIAVSDVWVVYESTSALEAWLLGKQTCLLNPSGRDFVRETYISDGSPDLSTVDELSSAIEAYYESEQLPGFAVRQTQRDIAIKEIIEYADGLNHVRAGNMILDLLVENEKVSQHNQERFSDCLARLKMKIKWLIYPFYGKYKKNYNYMSDRTKYIPDEVEKYSRILKNEQMRFYARLNMSLEELRAIR